MNNFATIKLVQSFKKVTYYTLQLNEDEESLFELFMKKHTIANKNKLIHILAWTEAIGNKTGAKELYFRNEAETADTSALPPQGIFRKPAYIEHNERIGHEEHRPNDLRLYYLRANNYVAFLLMEILKLQKRHKTVTMSSLILSWPINSQKQLTQLSEKEK